MIFWWYLVVCEIRTNILFNANIRGADGMWFVWCHKTNQWRNLRIVPMQLLISFFRWFTSETLKEITLTHTHTHTHTLRDTQGNNTHTHTYTRARARANARAHASVCVQTHYKHKYEFVNQRVQICRWSEISRPSLTDKLNSDTFDVYT